MLAPNTASTYGTVLTNHILPTLGGMRMDAVNWADVQSLVKDRVVPATPCVDITLPKTASKAALMPIHTATVLALPDELPERYRAFAPIAAGTGMRHVFASEA